MPPPELTLVLPAHNEAEVIADSLRRTDTYLGQLELSYEIIVGDSASTDGTGGVVSAIGLPNVRLVRSSVAGKGAILTRCFQEARGSVLGFIDADLEIDVSYVGPMLAALRDGYDAVIASKVRDPALSRNRPIARRASTWLYNALARTLFNTPFRDHQAGLKLFRREPLVEALDEMASAAWLWDTELLVRLVRRGHRVYELPVNTTPREDSRFVRTGSSLALLRELALVYRRLRR